MRRAMGIKGTSKLARAASQLCKFLWRHRNALGHEPSASINGGRVNKRVRAKNGS